MRLVQSAMFRDRSQTLVGGLMQKNIIEKIFRSPPTSKNFSPPFFFFCLENYRVNPIQKHVDSFFTGEFVVFFFKTPLQGSDILRAPFLHQVPTSVCERSLITTFLPSFTCRTTVFFGKMRDGTLSIYGSFYCFTQNGESALSNMVFVKKLKFSVDRTTRFCSNSTSNACGTILFTECMERFCASNVSISNASAEDF